MKNKKLRNVLISVCSAVFVGVLLLGINAAVGDAPGYDPPGGGVSPTFTGLTVTGDAQIAGTTVLYGDLTAIGDTNRFDGDLEVDGILEVLEHLVVSGFYGITTGSPTDPDPVKIDDDLMVAGDIDTISIIATNDVGALDDLSSGDDIFIGDDINLMGSSGSVIRNWNGDTVKIEDNLLVTGTNSIGSFYRITGSQSPTSSYTLSCYAYDYMVGCSGYASDEYRGSLPLSETSCKSYSEVSTGRVYTRVLCFDPNGFRTGDNPL